ncbi:hypothetical protein PARMER_02979 [Parabacteroides merdae ATCC 43184]|nr:hypothetical protein PARMER_02979 [Parabacteroides merdae ATCC 43184]
MTGFFSYYKYTNKTSIMQIFTALYSIISTLIFPQHEDRIM